METAITSFLFGLVATASPCVLPLYPGFLAYLSGQGDAELGQKRYFLGFFVLAGVLTMMLALGGLIALLSIPAGRVLAYLIPAADVLILLLGVLLILNINLFKSLPQIQSPVFKRPFLNAYLYGFLYGPIALPCSAPLVVGIFAYSFTAGEAVSKLWVFLWFGLGFGMPLLLLSFLSGSMQRQLPRFFARNSRVVNLVGGILLVGIAMFDLYKNWSLLQLFWR